MSAISRTRERVYIAGPMTGYPLLNFPAFDRAAKKWRKAGYEVINPADLDRVNGTNEYTPASERCSYREALQRDLTAICGCDSVALLPGWEKSPGVSVELTLAKVLKLKIYDSVTMREIKIAN